MDRKNRGIIFTLGVMLTCCVWTATAKAAQAVPEDVLELDVPAYILMECASGEVVAQKNAEQAFDLAGVTKMMSALVLAQDMQKGSFDLQSTCQVNKDAAKAAGMSAFLSPNGSYPVEALLKSMLMISANDATLTLASLSAGSEEAFVQKMNQSAQALGIEPVFVNATGHNATGQAMSVKQAGVIACELVNYPQILQYSGLYMDNITHAGGRKTELVNPNKLVRFYSGCDGLATGSNPTALYSGAFTATRENQRFIAIIAGAKNSQVRFDAAQKLLDYGFANFQSVVTIEKGKGVCRDVPVEGGVKKTVHGVAAQSGALLIQKGAVITKQPTLFTPELTAPVSPDQKIGELIVQVDGVERQRIPIVAFEGIEKASIVNSFVQATKAYLGVTA